MKKIFILLIIISACTISYNTAYSQPYRYPVLPGDDLWKNTTNYITSENWKHVPSSGNSQTIEKDIERQNSDIYSFDIPQVLFDEEEFVKILTPLGYQPNENQYSVHSSTWTDETIERCNQAWLFSGGLFKSSGSCTFTEMNNYLIEHTVWCMEIDGDNIYIGTDDGIYMSTNYGDIWLKQEDDGIDNLPGMKVLAISVSSNTFFAGTDAGIHVSTDSGQSWEQSLSSKTITCIEYGENQNIYIGASNAGVYKSTDYGTSWNQTGLTRPTYCLKFDAGDLYAGTSSLNYNLMKTTNGGTDWESLWGEDKVLSIYINGSNIYIGTDKKGCYRSTNDGQNFYDKNSGLPMEGGIYYSLNSLQEFAGELYAAFDATEKGLYNTGLQTISWSACNVLDNYFKRETEKSIKMVFINNNPNDLWVACYEYEEPKWGTATMITDYDYPLNPENFPNHICHTFAWHLSEGGVSGVGLLAPNSMSYTTADDYTDWEKENWDYIQTVWNDPLWDKITYSWGHSGIKSLKNDPDETDENELIIESKWGSSGPLVEHKLLENQWAKGATIRYWKSKKVVSRPSEQTSFENQCIGRQIITNDETIIKDGDTINFYVAPMYEHKINLKPGFHAEYGANFHAYVKNEAYGGCEIPWEEGPDKSSEQENYANINKFNTSSDTISNEDSASSATSLATVSNDNKIPQFDTIPCKEHEYEDFKYSGKGIGTEEDPYQITNVNQLAETVMDFYGDNYWVLMNDIDASETRYWHPRIHNGDTLFYRGFSGIPGNYVRSLDGRGHIVRNIYQKSGEGGILHLIYGSNCLTLKRIGFEDVNIESGAFTLFSMHYKDIDFIIEECYITGKIEGTYEGTRQTIVFGSIYSNAIVRNCYSDVTIISDSAITSFSKIWVDGPKIENCYAVGSAIGPKVNSPFGHTGNVISCFWDNEKIVITDSAGKGLGLPTSEMMKRSTFESAGWDFENVWYIEEGMDYPKLRAFKRDTTDVVEKSPSSVEYFINAFPNPFTNTTEIRYSIPRSSSVTIKIYNVLGVQVKEVLNEAYVPVGAHKVIFDASDFPAGVYFYTLITPYYSETKQMMVIK